MKFRFVLLGPEDDPNHSVSQSEDAAKQLSLSSRRVRYERSGPGMVRIERLENGRTIG